MYTHFYFYFVIVYSFVTYNFDIHLKYYISYCFKVITLIMANFNIMSHVFFVLVLIVFFIFSQIHAICKVQDFLIEPKIQEQGGLIPVIQSYMYCMYESILPVLTRRRELQQSCRGKPTSPTSKFW